MNAHTPGPWFIGKRVCSPPEFIAIVGDIDSVVCEMPYRFGEACKADARLIAAAPELLSILERILYAHDTKNSGASMGEAVLCNHYALAARDAIAKARGEA